MANINSEKAVAIIRYYAVMNSGLNLLPIPLVDSLAISTSQFVMIRELSVIFNKDVSNDLIKTLLASISGGVLSYILSDTALAKSLKMLTMTIPVIGLPLRFLAGPVIVGSYTYVLGHAILRHFESGLSLQEFDVAVFKHHANEILNISD